MDTLREQGAVRSRSAYELLNPPSKAHFEARYVVPSETAPEGTVINAGAFTVPAALGDKNIHPFGDYLLHTLGTGDGIVQNGGQAPAT
jgi:hypothetical protein